MPHIIKPHEILAIAKLPKDQDRAEVRIYASAMTLFFIFSCLSPAFFIFLVPMSDVAITTRVTELPGHFIGAAFFLSALGAMPHLASLIFIPKYLNRREPRLCAIYSAVIAGLTWLYLGVTVEPLDFGDAPWAYWARAIASALVAGVYAYSLNSQLLRENDKSAELD